MRQKTEDIYLVFGNAIPLHAVRTKRQAEHAAVMIADLGLGIKDVISYRKIKLIYPRELSDKQLKAVKATLTKKSE